MYQQQQGVVIPMIVERRKKVSDILPGIFPGLLAVFQMILWFAILGLESASVYYDAGRGIIYAGFWCSVVFFITWISMLCYLCCGQTSSCGVFLIIQNTISLIFAIILIVFTSLFINDPCLCYSILCKVPAWDDIANENYNEYLQNFRGSCTERTYRKLPVLKGLLSCAVLMLVSNILFIIVYIIAYITLRNKRVSNPRIQSTEVPAYQSSSMMNSAYQYERPYLVQNPSDPHYYSQTEGVTSKNEIPSAPIESSYSHRF